MNNLKLEYFSMERNESENKRPGRPIMGLDREALLAALKDMSDEEFFLRSNTERGGPSPEGDKELRTVYTDPEYARFRPANLITNAQRGDRSFDLATLFEAKTQAAIDAETSGGSGNSEVGRQHFYLQKSLPKE